MLGDKNNHQCHLGTSGTWNCLSETLSTDIPDCADGCVTVSTAPAWASLIPASLGTENAMSTRFLSECWFLLQSVTGKGVPWLFYAVLHHLKSTMQLADIWNSCSFQCSLFGPFHWLLMAPPGEVWKWCWNSIKPPWQFWREALSVSSEAVKRSSNCAFLWILMIGIFLFCCKSPRVNRINKA